MNKIEFGKFIYNRRKKLNLSQQALANELCLSNQAISNWERGISYPEISYLQDLSKTLKINIEDLCLLKDSDAYEEIDLTFDIDKLSNTLAVLRKLNNMSQAELASKLNIQYQTISSWERGVSLPSIDQIVELSNIYSVSISELYYGNIKPVNQEETIIQEKTQEIKVKKKNILPIFLIAFCVIILGVFIGQYFSKESGNQGYRINFEGFDNNLFITNNKITSFPDASKEGYIFLGWYYNDELITEDTIITKDMILIPKYQKKNLTITFLVDGKIYLKEEVEYGSDFVDFPVVPKRNLYNGYWDIVEIKNIQDDVVVNAIYKINVYQVVLLDDENNVISIQNVEHGKTITEVKAPEKEGFTFVGWSEDLSIITKNVTCNAIYERNKYQITIVNEGSIIKKETVLHDYDYTLPTLNKRGYAFDGFIYKDELYKGTIKVKNDMTFDAKYTKLPVHNIIFKDGSGNIIKKLEAFETEEFDSFDDYISENQIFGGWVYDQEYISYPFIFNFKEDIVLYASFIKSDDLFIISTINEEEVAIVGIKDNINVKTIIIPDMIDNKKVVRITENVFKDNNIVECIKFGKYINKLENKCFENCINLKEVYLNNDIIQYGSNCFNGCTNFEKLHINGKELDQVLKIFDVTGPEMHVDIYINEGTMFENVTEFNLDRLPNFCGLHFNIFLPSDLEIISIDTFVGHSIIDNIYVTSSNLTIDSYAFRSFNVSLIFTKKLENLVIKQEAFADSLMSNPLQLNSKNITLDLQAFNNVITVEVECDNLTIEGLTHVMDNCWLTLIIKAKEVQNIKANTFINKNTIIEIYGSVKKIEENAFTNFKKIIFHTEQDQSLWSKNWCSDESKVEYNY